MRKTLEKMLLSDGATLVPSFLEFMKTEFGLRALPELAKLAPDAAVLQNRLHKDNLTHSIWVCAQTPNGSSLRLRWASLYHDVGKAATRNITQEGHVSFHGHEDLGAKLTRRRLSQLGYEENFIDEVTLLVQVSGRISSFAEAWSDSAVRRMARDLNDDPALIRDALDLVAADCTSKHERNRIAARERAAGFAAALADVQARDSEMARRPPVDGLWVMQVLGLTPSREVGVALKWLLANHEHSTPEVATQALREWWGSKR